MYKNKRYKQKLARDDMSPKAYELVNDMYGMVIWAGTLAIVLAFLLVNMWLINEIGVMVGIEAAKYTIAAAAIAASAWVFGHKGEKK